jgi:DNA-binding PadR family transcriptional regulator
VSGVFSRGRMRLYLLKLLDEQPRHGYEILQLLEERLGGTYAPSPGSVYPRLRRLEGDGLITHAERGGRKVYSLTDQGRAEVAERGDELAELDQDIKDSVTTLAEEVDADIRSTVRDIGSELAEAARDLPRHGGPRRRGGSWKTTTDWPSAPEFGGADGMIEAQLHVLVTRVRELAARSTPRSDQVGACAAILDETYRRIAHALIEDD